MMDSRTGAVLLFMCLTIHYSNAIDVKTSILSDNVKIAIVDNNQITLSLNKGDGKRHVHRIGQSIPLVGQPRWSTGPSRFKCIWDNGVRLTLTARQHPNGVFGLKTSWKAPPEVLTLQQCIDLSNSNWYGGTEWLYQAWPIQNNMFVKTAFVPGYPINGGVMAPYFLSSASISYFVLPTNPLFVSVGTEVENGLCLTVEFKRPYRNTDGRPLVLDMDTTWNDPPNMTDLWLSNSLAHFGHPDKTPSFNVSRTPIWSTWAAYKTNINQTLVTDFAQTIHDRGFPASQIAIDDKWETCYGDEKFDPVKFPDPAAMVSQIKSLGYDVTLWIHPFLNIDCPSFAEAEAGGYLVTVNGTNATGITSWWQGNNAGIIDITNPSAAAWWWQRLTDLKTNVGITAFKFDAGEASWLPRDAYLSTDESLQPGSYSTLYSQFAKPFGGNVEVRVGYFSQRQGGVFVRLLDRDSVWGLANGLHSVLTGTLHFGIVGYPFVLPDYIGGNAYGIYPDKELFIRWTQLTAFLPVMQFSILPWTYDEQVSNVTLKMIQLHQNISDVINDAAAQSVRDGSPIIRPVWWPDWTDATAQVVNDQFLVGSTYLVAPIVNKGAVTRDIYVPKGTWTDMLRGGDVTGPTWLRNYTIALEEIAYFKNTAV